MTALLQVDNLRTYFETDRGIVKSVDGISFEHGRGAIFRLVGQRFNQPKQPYTQMLLNAVPKLAY